MLYCWPRFLAEFIRLIFFMFFFQAEDGIRDIGVTGVQTCALPISRMIRVWRWTFKVNTLVIALIVLVAMYLLADMWLPLGPQNGTLLNLLFVGFIVGMVLLILRSEEHTSELQSRQYIVCRLLLEKKK